MDNSWGNKMPMANEKSGDYKQKTLSTTKNTRKDQV